MRIMASTVDFASQRTATTSYQRTEKLEAWVGERPPAPMTGQRGGASDERGPRPAFMAMISQEARAAASAGREGRLEQVDPPGNEYGKAHGKGKASKSASDETDSAVDTDPKLSLFAAILRALTGREVRVVRAELDGSKGEGDGEGDAAQALGGAEGAAASGDAQASERAGWGVQYDMTERYSESETTTFSAQGVVRTIDGLEIAFNVDLAMSRQYVEENAIHFRAGDAKLQDPLVINFNGAAAQLTSATFVFDINQDGVAEQIPVLGAGSAFIAFDRNANGTIDDGSELLGASTGDGFSELGALDADGNGWVDEGDPAYAQLSTWTKDASGTETTVGLMAANVGAISVGSASTQFDVKDSANQTIARVQQTGVYLKESGGVGTVQKIDVAV